MSERTSYTSSSGFKHPRRDVVGARSTFEGELRDERDDITSLSEHKSSLGPLGEDGREELLRGESGEWEADELKQDEKKWLRL